MKKIIVSIWNKSDNSLPKYESAFASGLDLRADLTNCLAGMIELEPGERILIKTGLHVAIPEGYEIQIRPRSGLAMKHGISIVNTPGTIDSDYRGEIGVILINHGEDSFIIRNGDKIAQAIIKETNQIEWNEVGLLEELPSTARGEGGFGSTGK